MLLVAAPGHLAAYGLDGSRLWDHRLALQLTLYGCWDLAADGHTEILAGSRGLSGGKLYLFDASAGDLIWTSPPTRGDVGAVKVLNIDSSRALELLWLPATSSVLQAYTFASGASQPTLLWASEIQDFISDPYTFSSIGVTKPGVSAPQIVISGGRHQIPVIVLDARNGAEISRRTYPEAHGMESGGYGQLLALKDVDGSGVQQIITIADYPSSAQYMFQGATVTSSTNTDDTEMFDTSPVGLHYVSGSVADFDGDGKDEILVSRYVPESNRHDLLLLSAIDLSIKASLQDFYLLAIVDLGDAQKPLILGLSGVVSESLSGGTAVACRYDDAGFHQTDWQPGLPTLATLLPRVFDQAAVDNPGTSAVVLKAVNGPSPAILLLGSAVGESKLNQLVAADARTGAAVARYSAPAGVGLQLIAVTQDATAAKSRVVMMGDDGNLVFLDGALRQVASISVGGYYQSHAFNGHSLEVAAVADLNGRGKNEIVVADSRDRVVKLAAPAASAEILSGQVLWDSGQPQELVAVPWQGGGSRLVVRGFSSNGLSKMILIDGQASTVWEHLLTPEDDFPIGLNFGFFQQSSQADIVASCGNNASFPRATCAFDGRTGALLWRSSVGTYWDATLAVEDFNGDGVDDVVLNYNIFKASVLDGQTGQPLNSPIVLPEYQDLEAVDYNGAPIVAGSHGDSTAVINAEDDAHLALISVIADRANEAGLLDTRTTWVAPQESPDDQRYSMPALAPDGQGGWFVGVGSQRGTFKALKGDGTLAWSVFLWNGQVEIVPGDAERQNFLSSVAAVDINGDGHTEFLVGGLDGWLYALEAETGSLLWSIDLGAPVGDPIAADINSDGLSEILVPVADGYLYAIGPKSP